MELNEKLQELRRQKGLTQEELAKKLFVSRTAISKWESGRGYPNIDSLKAISAFFSVTVDDLLSGSEILSIAEEEQKKNSPCMCDFTFGILDLSAAWLMFFPLLAERIDDTIHAKSLLSVSAIQPYLKTSYFVVVIFLILSGVLTFAMQNCQAAVWQTLKYKLSLALCVTAVLLFIVSLQPYAAVFTFLLLVIKVIALQKSH